MGKIRKLEFQFTAFILNHKNKQTYEIKQQQQQQETACAFDV